MYGEKLENGKEKEGDTIERNSNTGGEGGVSVN